MSELPNPDVNDIGRYGESAPAVPSAANGGFSEWLNKALRDVSAAITRSVQLKTIWTRQAATIPSSTNYQALSFDTLSRGSDFTHAAGVLTCQRDGVYQLQLSGSFAGNATGGRSVRLTGAPGTRTAPIVQGVSATLDTTLQVSFTAFIQAGQTITAQAFQSSGVALAVAAELVLDRAP